MTAAAVVADLRRLAEEAVARHGLAILVARSPAAAEAMEADADLRLLVMEALEERAEPEIAHAALVAAIRERAREGRP